MTKEEKLVFGVAKTDKEGDVLMLGMSDAAWNYCKNGMTHTLDLTPIGLPIKLIVFGGRTQAEIKKLLTTANTLDVSGLDMGMKSGE